MYILKLINLGVSLKDNSGLGLTVVDDDAGLEAKDGLRYDIGWDLIDSLMSGEVKYGGD